MKIPYPLRAFKIQIAFHPFTIFGGTWFDWVNLNSHLPESTKANGKTIWWLRLGPFTISYGRML